MPVARSGPIYELFGNAHRDQIHAAHALNDHTYIRHGKGFWMPRDAADEHQLARTFIQSQLDHRGCRQAVIVTHHAPSLKSAAPKWQRDPLTAAFATDCERLADRAALWIHGHMHAPADYQLGNCRVICNPRGYVGLGESTPFNPALVATLPGALTG